MIDSNNKSHSVVIVQDSSFNSKPGNIFAQEQYDEQSDEPFDTVRAAEGPSRPSNPSQVHKDVSRNLYKYMTSPPYLNSNDQESKHLQ